MPSSAPQSRPFHTVTPEFMASHVWSLIEAATTTRTAFTPMQLSTVDQNSAPRSRTVILRRAHPDRRTIELVTDHYSRKVQEILHNPRVALSGYDPEEVQQLRLEGHARVINDDRRRQAMWGTLKPHSHALFRTALLPGQPIDAPSDSAAIPDDDVTHDGPAHPRFALIEIEIERADWFSMLHLPHRRYQLDWTGHAVHGTWVIP